MAVLSYISAHAYGGNISIKFVGFSPTCEYLIPASIVCGTQYTVYPIS